MDVETYMKDRVDDQINWYELKSSVNQKSYKRLRLIEIVAAAAITLLVGLVTQYPNLTLVIGGLGILVAVISGSMGVFKFYELWAEYRLASESLKQQKFLFLTNTAPYDQQNKFNLFVESIENIIKDENSRWAQSNQADAAGNTALPAEDNKLEI